MIGITLNKDKPTQTYSKWEFTIFFQSLDSEFRVPKGRVWYFVTRYREKNFKLEVKGQEFAKFLRSLEQFIEAVKCQNNFWWSSFILRTQLRDPHFFQKRCHFRWNQTKFSENDNAFERNEDRVTGFLKQTGFSRVLF